MIQINLLEELLMKYLREEPCTDRTCPECNEIQQVSNSVLLQKFFRNVVGGLKRSNCHEDILQTFYLGFKLGRDLEKLNGEKNET